MKIKINWGVGIALFFVLFIFSVFFRIWLSYQQDLNLVTPSYYPKEVKHQQQIEKVNNTNSLAEKISIAQFQDSIVVLFPKYFENKAITGTISLYRPSDSKADKFFPITLNAQLSQVLKANNLLKGKYIIQIDWLCNEKGYYQEQDIFIK